MLAETRVNTAHLIARSFLEQGLDRVKNVQLEQIDGATLESAKTLDQQQSNYRESASHYYTVYVSSKSLQERANAVIGLSQELINLQSFRKARKFLGQASRFSYALPEVQKLLFEAQVEGKKGWIADYELGYWDELKHFGNAVEILEQVPKEKWGTDGDELYSTAKHFSGRARYWLAASGINEEDNILGAFRLFQEGIDLDTQLEVLTSEEKLGHGFAWKARCCLLIGLISDATESIDLAKIHYQEHEKRVGKSAVMAHWYVLKGSRDLQVGLLDNAKGDFKAAIKIRNEVGQYSQGLAAAYSGLAVVSWKEGKKGEALGYTIQAAKINPLVILRGGIGG